MKTTVLQSPAKTKLQIGQPKPEIEKDTPSIQPLDSKGSASDLSDSPLRQPEREEKQENPIPLGEDSASSPGTPSSLSLHMDESASSISSSSTISTSVEEKATEGAEKKGKLAEESKAKTDKQLQFFLKEMVNYTTMSVERDMHMILAFLNGLEKEKNLTPALKKAKIEILFMKTLGENLLEKFKENKIYKLPADQALTPANKEAIISIFDSDDFRNFMRIINVFTSKTFDQAQKEAVICEQKGKFKKVAINENADKTFHSYLIVPVQQTTKYKLIMDSVVKNCGYQSDNDKQKITDIHNYLINSAENANTAKKRLEEKKLLSSVYKLERNQFLIFNPGRAEFEIIDLKQLTTIDSLPQAILEGSDKARQLIESRITEILKVPTESRLPDMKNELNILMEKQQLLSDVTIENMKNQLLFDQLKNYSRNNIINWNPKENKFKFSALKKEELDATLIKEGLVKADELIRWREKQITTNDDKTELVKIKNEIHSMVHKHGYLFLFTRDDWNMFQPLFSAEGHMPGADNAG